MQLDIRVVMRDLIVNRAETPADHIVVLVLQTFTLQIRSLALCVKDVNDATGLISEDSHLVGHLLQDLLDIVHFHFWCLCEVDGFCGGVVTMEAEWVELPKGL